MRAAAPAWLEDVVPAYASVGVHFDADRAGLREVLGWLAALRPDDSAPPTIGSLFEIPVCYKMAPDMARVAARTGLTSDEIIAFHSGREYAVHAVGFVPGFPYLGHLPDALCGVPRLATPRVRVEAGSVGLTGRQTGVYPLPRPGGWSLVGRTPLVVADPAAGFFPLRVGDRVAFRRIDEAEYGRLEGERLSSRE